MSETTTRRRRAYAQALTEGTQAPPARLTTPSAVAPLAGMMGGPDDVALHRMIMQHALRTADTPGLRLDYDLAGEAGPNVPTQSRSEDRVSTRIPWAKGTKHLAHGDPHRTAAYSADIDAARASGDAYQKNAMLMRGDPRNDHFPDLPVKGLRNADQIIDRAIEHMKQNLIYLHNKMVEAHGQDYVNRASLWYDGANDLAHRWANEYGHSPRKIAAIIANMSPQKDWYQNVSLAKRMLDTHRDMQGSNATVDMSRWTRDYLKQAEKKANTPKKQAALDDLRMQAAPVLAGRGLNEINDPQSRAFWIRAYDEAHNDRSYHIVDPEGTFGDIAKTQGGKPQKVAWGSFGEIGKALRALEGPDELEHISKTLGGNHKVRNFYNNIIAPNHGHDVTIDTHAVAAAHLRPLSGEDFPVETSLGLSGSSDAKTGMKGTYGVVAHAYREAAKELKLLPRQLQSITWEGVRGMFGAEDKRNVPLWNENYYLWKAHKDGRETDAAKVRDQVLNHAKGIDPADWWRPTGIPMEPETR